MEEKEYEVSMILKNGEARTIKVKELRDIR
jgi:hypothetical protein